MSALDSASRKSLKSHSRRKHVDRKIRRFSVSMGVAGTLLTLLVYVASSYPFVLHWRNINLHALSEIDCTGLTCDTSGFTTDSQWEDPDYLIDTRTRYIIDVEAQTGPNRGRFSPLDYSDTDFLARFRQPTSYTTPDGEVWRMYSKAAPAGGNKSFEVVVGYAVKSPSKPIETPESLMGDVDSALEREADKLALGLSAPTAPVWPSRSGSSVDGFQVVDPQTRQVVEQGPWLPSFLPTGVSLPVPGLKLYIYNDIVYAAHTDTNGRLLATSFSEVGNSWWIACWCAAGFFCTSAITNFLSRRFLRNYFALTGIRVPSLKESLRSGEGQNVEFKRGLSDNENRSGSVEEELLKSITAFANSNDGVIFIGVDDAGHVKGLGLDFSHKDRMERKIRQLIRARILPTPPVQLAFEEFSELVVGKVAVAKGDVPPYMIGGTIYIRHGSSDVQARPDEVVRLVSQL